MNVSIKSTPRDTNKSNIFADMNKAPTIRLDRSPAAIEDEHGNTLGHAEGVAAVLRHLGWTRADLAEKCGVTLRSITNHCNGARAPTIKMLTVMAEGLRAMRPDQIQQDAQARHTFGDAPWTVRFPQGVLRWDPQG